MSWSRILSTLAALGCVLLVMQYREHDIAIAGGVLVAHLAGYVEALLKRGAR